jgi:hypothetical protein
MKKYDNRGGDWMITNIDSEDIHHDILEEQEWEENWDKNIRCYVYTIYHEGITSFSKCTLDYDYSHIDGNITKIEQFDSIYRIETDTDYIFIYSDMKPTEDIPIEFVVVDVCFR